MNNTSLPANKIDISVSRMVKDIIDNMFLNLIPYAQEMMYAKNLYPDQHNSSNRSLLFMLYTRQKITDIIELFDEDNISKTRFAFYSPEKYLSAYVKNITALFDKRLLRVSVDTSDCDTDVIFDMRRVNLILSHLISNAVMHSKTRENLVKIKAFMRGDSFVISVSNNGCKIPKSRATTLFSAYDEIIDPRRIKDFCTSFSDAKIGLSICLKTAREMNGDLVYVPNPKLTVFELSIPQKQRSDLLLEDVEYISDMSELKLRLAGAMLHLSQEK